MRTVRPLIWVAYGPAGRTWLGRAAELCRRLPFLQPLIESGVVQFWLVDGRPEHGSAPRDRERPGVTRVAAGAGAAELRALLDAGRSARNRAALGDLSLHTALVIERWSLFDDGAANRPPLRAALDAARRIDCEPGNDAEFEYDWISLLDCTRPPGRPGAAAVQRARHALRHDGLPDRHLLIDRVDAAGAIIDRDVADRCFLAAALALAASDVAFPPRAGGDDRRSQTLAAEIEPDFVVPVGVLALLHRTADVERVLSERRRHQLVTSPGTHRAPGSRPGTGAPSTGGGQHGARAAPAARASGAVGMPDLTTLVARDAEELAAGRFSPREARLRRTRAAEALLCDALMRGDGALDALTDVDHARAAARIAFDTARRTPDRTGAGSPPPNGFRAAAVLPAAWLAADAPPVIAATLIIAATAAATAAVAWLRRRRDPGPDPGAAFHPAADDATAPAGADAPRHQSGPGAAPAARPDRAPTANHAASTADPEHPRRPEHARGAEHEAAWEHARGAEHGSGYGGAGAGGSSGAAVGGGAPTASEDVARQWELLCDGLTGLLQAWRTAVADARRAGRAGVAARAAGAAGPVRASAAGVWERAADGPFEWRLSRHPRPVSGGDADARLYTVLAAEALRIAFTGTDPAEALDAALRELARVEIGAEDGGVRELVLSALEESHVVSLREAVRGSPLLVHAGRRLAVAEVVWLVPAGSGEEPFLERLEPADHRRILRFLSHEDAGRTVRLSFGEPVRWRDVLSLAPLGSG